ncbi:MAG: hypothetical protein J7L04_03960, partial [Bacteroidales bacterium]|nr:hypothetical protein [Bacteroidales bacterium]
MIPKPVKTFFLILFILTGISTIQGNAQNNGNNSAGEDSTSEYIFPLQNLHVHSSSIVELPNGDLLACWFEGSGERTANDVLVKG